MKFFGSKYLMVFLENVFQFDIFDLEYELKESTIGPSKKTIQNNSFQQFIYNSLQDECYLMDKKYIYAFQYKKSKYSFSHSKYIAGKDQKFLFCSNDGEYLFTLKENKICARDTKQLNKISNMKVNIKKVQLNFDTLHLLNDERLLLGLNLSSSAFYAFDMVTQKIVYSFEIGFIQGIQYSRDCEYILMYSETSIFIF